MCPTSCLLEAKANKENLGYIYLTRTISIWWLCKNFLFQNSSQDDVKGIITVAVLLTNFWRVTSRLKVQKLRDQSESSSVFLRGLYALGTECVRSDGYGASTELVRSGYGAARSIFFRSPYPPPKIHFKMILSSFPLRKKLWFFFTPPGAYPLRIFPYHVIIILVSD